MKISMPAKKFLFIFGVGAVIFFLVRPRNARGLKTSKEPDPGDQKYNASVVLEAYMSAVKAKEPASALEELNKLTEKKYGLRVYKKAGDGKYYVMDDKGNDVKMK